ncbi:helix-turn-helix domain-containing protein [Tepidimonas charontis]|uniref:helix-turn-helix domain-containing protein n=1 Tax=Tepidimonas charontis TaxID=2267262 RepID=UPI001186BF20|nr:helix-turn-helix transcriptional regulator [Tepidimonas charontis]
MPPSLYDPRYQKLRSQLKAARQQRGITQTALAARLGVGQSFVSKMERGEAFIDVILFVDWCHSLSIDPAAVLGFLRHEPREAGATSSSPNSGL